jgi:hypothetical protein
MARKSIPFSFNGTSLTIFESSWTVRSLRDRLSEEAPKEAGENKLLAFFAREIYPLLASCSAPIVPLEKAFRLPPQDLDNWYQAARQVNPTWFDLSELTEEEVTFSDGRTITVQSNRPSVMIRRMYLEEQLDQGTPFEAPRDEMFRRHLYPRLAGCSVGDVPTLEYAMAELSDERDLPFWYDAAKRQIPAWFQSLEEAAAQAVLDAKDEQAKKNKPAEQ